MCTTQENLDWSPTTVVITQTVLTAKEYLDNELKKGWEALNKSIKCLFNNVEQNMKNVRGKGVGQTTLLKFLGSNWKQWMIQFALEVPR